ncbi:MAG: flippase-like domain-containing protein [Bacteroidetes bacterium]|nr:flippase-like domain-containing protein [Bacteroidota bacterium]MCH8524886.1 flippase-like domain-containing protein [Balneolales bacterium]
MAKRILHVLLGVTVASLFIWLSLREADLQEVIQQLGAISYGWVIPFILIVLAGNFARAERWKMVLDDETGGAQERRVLFSGVMYGLAANTVVPRAGELLRALYVSRKSGIESSRLFGTVVQERVIDLLMMLGMLLVTVILLVRDERVLNQIFGQEGAAYISALTSTTGILFLSISGIIVFIMLLYLRKYRSRKSGDPLRKDSNETRFLLVIKNFVRGVISIRNLRNWPLFLLYTVVIWTGYVAMSLLPFYAFNFHIDYGFGWEQAFAITVIGAVGVMLPSPGGIGTYHYMVQQGLYVLYGVPVMTALSYATVNHFANLFTILLAALILYVVNHLKKSDDTDEEIPFSELIR